MESTGFAAAAAGLGDGDGVLAQDALLLALLGVTSRAPPHVFGYLTARDLMQLPVLSKTVRRHLREVEYTHCKDGRLYRVPFPGFPGLLENTPTESGNGLFPHQLASLRAMQQMENANMDYGALRGGVLGDAPGLGKTITMLALIVSTAGRRPQLPVEFWNQEEIQAGWEALSNNPCYAGDMMKVIKPFRYLSMHSKLAEEVRPPFQFATIKEFAKHVRDRVRGEASEGQLELFRHNLLDLQAQLDKSHRKIRKSQAGKRMEWERKLIPTSATLVVVPDALQEHWVNLIQQHLNRSLFAHDNQESGKGSTEGRGVVYIDGIGDIADARMPLGEVHSSKQPLPPPSELCNYMIVVTTFSRCEQEFHRGVVLTSSSEKRRRTSNEDEDDFVGNGGSEAALSTLLQMRWQRLVVDEGHELGTHEGGSTLVRFIHQMAADRRWVLSGTPTTGDEDDVQFSSKALDQLQRLLVFLRHPQYGKMPKEDDNNAELSLYVNRRQGRSGPGGKKKARDAWAEQVKHPFLARKDEGRAELLNILRSVMVMHRKEDLHLPKPIFRQAEVDVPVPDEVQANIVAGQESSATLLQEYLYTDDFQGRVDAEQGHYIHKAIQKEKEALEERGGALKLADRAPLTLMSAEQVADADAAKHVDRRPIKAVVYSSSKNNLRDVTEALYSKLGFDNIAEAYEAKGYDCSSELSRFRHNRTEVRHCPICGFQNTYARERTPKCQNYLLEVVKHDDSDVRFLVETEQVVRSVPVIEGGNVTTERLDGLAHSRYNNNRRAWRVGDLLEVNIQDPHPLLKKRWDEETWSDYGSETCVDLATRDSFYGTDWYFGPLPAVDVSESDDDGDDDNREREDQPQTMLVKLAKWQKCHKFHKHSRWYEGPRLSEAPLETIQENCFILALDAGLAVGLDLSFVTNIFLLEPIEDAALLEQITSRAHRLGATGPVTVETVNAFYKLDPVTEEAVQMSQLHLTRSKENSKKRKPQSGRKSNNSDMLGQDRKNALTKVVCHYCYRGFDSYAQAEAHEENQCARNPANADVVDPWHLSSVYREIRPPPPRSAEQSVEA